MKFEEGGLDEELLTLGAPVGRIVRVSPLVPHEIGQEIVAMPTIEALVFLLETFVSGFRRLLLATSGFAFSVLLPGANCRRGLHPGRLGDRTNGTRGAFGWPL